MTPSDFLAWFEQIEKGFMKIGAMPGTISGVNYYDHKDTYRWVAEAGSALEAVFPTAHSIRRTWDDQIKELKPEYDRGGSLDSMRGTFEGATRMLKEKRISTLTDAIRVEAEGDLLDQATALLDSKYLAAAAVIAGGALEAHLQHLVAKNGLTIDGAGSISKYDGAIGKARNDGTVSVYEAIDGKLVISWGAIRNEAAHDPGSFNRTQEEVRRMIDGVREFIARTR
jgi:hypothetical protein